MSADPRPPEDSYDRAGAARVLFGLARPRLFSGAPAELVAPKPQRVEYRSEAVARALGSHLSASQLEYVNRMMQPCPPYLVSAATGHITWRDSRGVVNVAHTGPLGAVVPVVAREATLELWDRLATDTALARRVGELDAESVRLLAATTTDRTPIEIFRSGLDAAARVLVQHAFLAAQTPYGTPAEFARGLRDSGIFEAVANTWHQGLQASTYRRGIIPASFVTFADRLRYSVDTVIALRAMKDAQLAQARELAEPAHYARLAPGERPRCLGQSPHLYDGQRTTVLTEVVDTFVQTFLRLLDHVEVVPAA
ncbi:copper chaperone [Kribbella sp. NPDC023972]|uniref:copper chaperone n=1 Tax=Kribbella sp. NPDC023972 TaxID=3154795 RepID=UPI0033F67168